ncbi:MAG: type IVB secretion system protein IcmH/DotU [Granulosicoccus sp.]|nr:type IVB secretion system protein IcmH/DotU [Granulosicoccus sp.]
MTDDPFAFEDDDKTVLRPGNLHPKQPAAPMQSGATPTPERAQQPIPLLGGINPLEQAASRLLPLLVTIRSSHHHPAPDQLRNQLIRELEAFKTEARDILDDPKKVTQASYVMCTALDEAAMNTPWGHDANWSQHNLLTTFHNEVAGGERFFTLLKGLGREPHENIDLLELMYICLALGYEGSYKIARNGQETLQKVRTWLYDLIQSVRDIPDSALSAHWQGTSVRESKLPRMTPLWVTLAGALALASVTYVSLLFSLGARAESVVSSFMSASATPLRVRTVAPPIQPVIQSPTQLTLSEHLEPEILRGQLAVIESFDHGIIRLVGDNLFGSGSAKINDNARALLSQMTSVLNQYDGAILVSGYSDNIPIRSAKFPSNLALSKARAESVSAILNEKLTQPARISAEGRGSLDPLGDNSTKQGRQLNRRVEITVYY